MKLIKKIYEKMRDADLNGVFLFCIFCITIVVMMLAIVYENQEREIAVIKERIDSCLNSPEVNACEQFNRNVDSVLYKANGPYCPTCGQKLKYYNEE